jgi:hypothetical protein
VFLGKILCGKDIPNSHTSGEYYYDIHSISKFPCLLHIIFIRFKNKFVYSTHSHHLPDGGPLGSATHLDMEAAGSSSDSSFICLPLMGFRTFRYVLLTASETVTKTPS